VGRYDRGKNGAVLGSFRTFPLKLGDENGTDQSKEDSRRLKVTLSDGSHGRGEGARVRRDRPEVPRKTYQWEEKIAVDAVIAVGRNMIVGNKIPR